ncbi:plasmid pRiA4b ORF-3 family protein [Cupriavidus sp. AcVe19-6a]|uniref:plasmid pRiA4b ORF-3 family protein n=1 Tax=Cupriavidus sp. AcVe19-6a TaxID=2821358 RepID=UPI001FD80DD3|nr:plasmid pRiA4b ORF-3 family protein [Cupriavidus sp. AcVe19-6a]
MHGRLSPPVWRRVVVPKHLTLGQLHHVIQVVMGWADEHLHTFSIRGRRYGEAHEGVLQFCTVANELPLTAFHLREHEGLAPGLARSPTSIAKRRKAGP